MDEEQLKNTIKEESKYEKVETKGMSREFRIVLFTASLILIILSLLSLSASPGRSRGVNNVSRHITITEVGQTITIPDARITLNSFKKS